MTPKEQGPRSGSASSAGSSSWVGSPPKTDLLPFTFGIEIEYLFALPLAVDAIASAHWLNIADSDLEHDTYLCNNPGLLNRIPNRPGTVRAIQQSAMILSKRTGHQIWRFPFKPKGISYEKWHITREVMADLDSNLHGKISKWTNNKINSAEESRAKWKFYGLELVSRILDFPDIFTKSAVPGPAIAEVRKFYEALSHKPGDDFFFISEVENAGFHMHVGLAPLVTTDEATGKTTTRAQDIDLKVLQHLAYITIEYERVISLLHHPQRRGFVGTKTEVVAISNRMGIQGHAHTCGQYPFPALAKVQSMIFDKDMTVDTLSELMSWDVPHQAGSREDRWRFINWTNISAGPYSDDENSGEDDEPQGKRTIEFRQQAGTLTVSDIEHWITFVASLVRAAEYQAKHYPTPPISPATISLLPANLQWSMGQGKKYSTRYESEDRMMDELFDLLHLRPSERKYWRARATMYKGDEYTKFDWYEACPECVDQVNLDDLHQAAKRDRLRVERLNDSITELTRSINRQRRRLVRSSWSPGDERHEAHLRIERDEELLAERTASVKLAEVQAEKSEQLYLNTIEVRRRTKRYMPEYNFVRRVRDDDHHRDHHQHGPEWSGLRGGASGNEHDATVGKSAATGNDKSMRF